MKRQYVCFKLNDQEFGINVADVIEVLPQQRITPIIHTPDFIKGVVNVRGEIVAIIDLKIFFSLESTRKNDNTKIVIVNSGDKTGGLQVDSISQIYFCEDVNRDTIPATITGKMAEYLNGVAKISERPLMIINVKALFDSEEFRQFE